MKIVGVILAAGLSSRMGELKPLMDVCGVSALARCCRALCAADTVYVVSGHGSEKIRHIIAAEGAEEVFNPRYEEGMFSSIRSGIARAAKEGANGVLLTLADCPLVREESVRRVIEAAKAQPEKLCVACFAGKKGHPLFVPQRLFGEILAHSGENGLKGVTSRYDSELVRVETLDEGVIRDMDTPEGYKAVLRLCGGEEKRLSELLCGRRLFLLRHGETVQHREKMFIGRYDVPLSPLGERQARAAAEKLAAANARPRAIYASPLVRAEKNAETAAKILGVSVITDERLCEISLGDWDGLSVGEVKRRWSAQYERRGENIAAYVPPNGESFFDLRLRSAQALRDILAVDASRDIVIVSHKGVLQSLIALIERREPDFTDSYPEKGGMIILET